MMKPGSQHIPSKQEQLLAMVAKMMKPGSQHIPSRTRTIWISLKRMIWNEKLLKYFFLNNDSYKDFMDLYMGIYLLQAPPSVILQYLW